MEINNAFNQGVMGFQKASHQLSQASESIAQLTTNEGKQISADRSPVSVTTELINMKIAEHQAIASAKVISTADEMIGSLIDTRV